MEISRRALITSGLVAGGAVAAGGFSLSAARGGHRARPDHARVDVPAGSAREGRLPARRAGGGRAAPGPRRPRRPARSPVAGAAGAGVLAFAQITDVHVVDVQSPARVEWVDRYDDVYQEGDPTIGLFGSAYRPQEMLTAHIAEAMVRAINEIAVGPGDRPAAGVHAADRRQLRQQPAQRDPLEHRHPRRRQGGPARLRRPDPVRGCRRRGPDVLRHPLLAPRQAAGGQGAPTSPSPASASRRSPGCSTPPAGRSPRGGSRWTGTPPSATTTSSCRATSRPDTSQLNAVATGSLEGHLPAARASARTTPATAWTTPSSSPRRWSCRRTCAQVTADPSRRLLTRKEVVEEHFNTTGTPVGHGFTERNRQDGTAYYAFDRRGVRFIVLDTVNPNGYADGSLDATQFAWLGEQLAAAAGPARGGGQPPHVELDDQPARRHRRRHRAAGARRRGRGAAAGAPAGDRLGQRPLAHQPDLGAQADRRARAASGRSTPPRTSTGRSSRG